ncbi:hypothetical protein D3C76_1700670 [compost metagenome]
MVQIRHLMLMIAAHLGDQLHCAQPGGEQLPCFFSPAGPAVHVLEAVHIRFAQLGFLCPSLGFHQLGQIGAIFCRGRPEDAGACQVP